MSVVAGLRSWLQENEDVFRSVGAEIEFRDSGRGSACVRLETHQYLMELCAWDHAFCLDIRVVDVNSGETRYPRAGSCESIDAFRRHLDEFLVWFKREVIEDSQELMRR